METKDIYIEVLEWGREKLRKKKKVGLDELKEFLRNKGFNVDDLSVRKIFQFGFGSANPRHSHDKMEYYLQVEAYFKLLEYEELNQARKDSKEAREEARKAIWWAKIAIWVAIGLGIIQIIVEVLK